MLDIKLIREKPEEVKKNTINRGYDGTLADQVIEIDREWRALKQEDDKLRAERNKVSEQVNQAKKRGDRKEAEGFIKKAKEIPAKLKTNEEKEKELKDRLDDLISRLPNMQSKEVPIGGAEKNKEVSKWGKIPKIKNVKGHLELAERLDIIDMKRATKIAGAGFYMLKGKGAKLQRALVQFMMDFHEKNGLLEINPPQMINQKSAFGTGNLPKFEDQLYKTQDGLYLVPTAEVPLTNMFSEETLVEKELPKKFSAFTECYRTEVGRKAGEEGLFRVHQFEKVEMVYITDTESSWDMLEEMTANAEKILKELEVPHRRLLLATGDASFASAKTYDLEVWSPALNRYLECSSCTNCLDFQARRMNTRYASKGGLKFVHTLNGSGIALPRLMISIIENNQREDGSIKVPKILWKYTGFKEIKLEKDKDKKRKNNWKKNKKKGEGKITKVRRKK